MSTTADRSPPLPHGPRRADARRNREKLLAAATDVFTESGADAPLDEIARRAGVGIGTLYGHFPARLDLQEAVFRDQVAAVCAGAAELQKSHSPGDALAAWLRILVGYMATKRGMAGTLMSTLGKGSQLVSSCSDQMKAAGADLLTSAQRAGAVREDIDIADLLRLVHAIVVATEHGPAEPGQRERLLSLALDGIRSVAPAAGDQEAGSAAAESGGSNAAGSAQ